MHRSARERLHRGGYHRLNASEARQIVRKLRGVPTEPEIRKLARKHFVSVGAIHRTLEAKGICPSAASNGTETSMEKHQEAPEKKTKRATLKLPVQKQNGKDITELRKELDWERTKLSSEKTRLKGAWAELEQERRELEETRHENEELRSHLHYLAGNDIEKVVQDLQAAISDKDQTIERLSKEKAQLEEVTRKQADKISALQKELKSALPKHSPKGMEVR